jgi:hypothetical protein
MCAVIALISDLLFSPAATIVASTAAAIVFSGLWFAGPLLRRYAGPPRD